MVVQAVFDLFELVIIGLLNAAPDVPLPAWWDSQYVEGVDTLGALAYEAGRQIMYVNGWLPVTEILDVVPFVLGATVTVLGFRVLMWAYGLVRGGGA